MLGDQAGSACLVQILPDRALLRVAGIQVVNDVVLDGHAQQHQASIQRQEQLQV